MLIYPVMSVRFAILVVICCALVSCATAPGPTVEEEAAPAIFYPPLPNPPRLQHLTTIASSKDLTGESNRLNRFITGSELGIKFPDKPYGVAIYESKVYVTDLTAGNYVVFDFVNSQYREVRGTGGGLLQRPANITIDEDGTKYITDVGRMQVMVYDKDDRYVKAYGLEGQFKPIDVAIHGDRLYVTDQQDDEIEILDKATGQVISTFGGRTKEETEDKEELLFVPSSIKIYNNSVYVVETGNTRVKQYSLDGKVVKNIGGIGLSHGQFVRPKGLAIDRDGVMYVVDSAFENVQMLSIPQDGPLMAFGGPGANPGNLNLPVDVEIDYNNLDLFAKYADPEFKLEYIVFVTSQFGDNKVGVWGYGKLDGVDYPDDDMSGADSNSR